MNTWTTYQRFRDRHEAGRELADELLEYKDDNPIVLALPRGGVVVGYEIAKKLDAALDVLCVRKIGAPHNPEFAIGALSENGVVILDDPTIRALGIPPKDLSERIEKEENELKRRSGLYRNDRSLPFMEGRMVIIVDDGLATGLTAQAAIQTIGNSGASEIVFAAPVCAYETAESLRSKADDIVCAITPYNLRSIGLYYDDFHQVSDEEVIQLLQRARRFGGEGVYYAQ
jgi:predicted phosphoribosyltransferase